MPLTTIVTPIVTSLCIQLSPIQEIECVATVLSNYYKIDPAITLAIIQVESSYKINAKGKHGELGLMQLRPQFFPTATKDIRHNLYLGISYLAYIRNKCVRNPGLSWVNCYNTGPYKKLDQPLKFPYYMKVRKAYERICRQRTFVSYQSQATECKGIRGH